MQFSVSRLHLKENCQVLFYYQNVVSWRSPTLLPTQKFENWISTLKPQENVPILISFLMISKALKKFPEFNLCMTYQWRPIMHSSISVQIPSAPEVYPSTQRHFPSSAHSILLPQLSTEQTIRYDQRFIDNEFGKSTWVFVITNHKSNKRSGLIILMFANKSKSFWIFILCRLLNWCITKTI